MKRRTRTEIVQQILQVVSKGSSKSEIMYKAYLSYSQLSEYLELLTQHKMIKRYAGQELYKITQKGQRLLEEFQGVPHEDVNKKQKNPDRPRSNKRDRIHRKYKFHG